LLAGLLAVAGCSSSSSSQPSWAAKLGSGVTVTGPAKVSAGNGSPGAAVEGLISTVNAKQYKTECGYLQPSQQGNCTAEAAGLSTTNAPYSSNTGIGYVAIQGDEALVGTTGTYCSPGQKPECYTNSDPAAIFSSGKSFSSLWNDANGTATGNVYSLAPCIQVNGKWYIN
jgi:hypothetical protein